MIFTASEAVFTISGQFIYLFFFFYISFINFHNFYKPFRLLQRFLRQLIVQQNRDKPKKDYSQP